MTTSLEGGPGAGRGTHQGRARVSRSLGADAQPAPSLQGPFPLATGQRSSAVCPKHLGLLCAQRCFRPWRWSSEGTHKAEKPAGQVQVRWSLEQNREGGGSSGGGGSGVHLRVGSSGKAPRGGDSPAQACRGRQPCPWPGEGHSRVPACAWCVGGTAGQPVCPAQESSARVVAMRTKVGAGRERGP